ncbi:MAG TPA: protein-L-isoaspartate O-methyltransferase [Vicinamibacterales bacterium]|jgi:protein-L-isoaspartate(D-aspartate) O-methyltransferase|nr:protein-L-isoaspartate O-methyltransferase [Vicinamibacterales bacterium]
MKMPDDLAATYQRQLLDQALQTNDDTPISQATVEAFLATPRHLFVRRYRERASTEWRDVDASNLTQHLATLYADNPLILFGDDDDNVPSTISQPSFVLRMLDLLQVRPGHAVLELGAGSGWNAALIGRLVGPSGRVVTLEIIPEVAQRAAATLAELNIANVHVISADGGDGDTEGAPYDRIVFTAGTYDLPRPLYEQIRPGGLMLAVIKDAGGGDNLFLLEKVDDHFESRYATPCGFVQLTGKYKVDTLDPAPVEALPQWSVLKEQEVGRRPFWWGGKGRELFMWQTAGIRSFLGVTEPSFRSFKTVKTDGAAKEQHYWGLWDPDGASLVLARDDELVSYGNPKATEHLLRLIHRWVDLGMPTASSFTLRVFRADGPVRARNDEWIVKRRDSQFVWSLLPGSP